MGSIDREKIALLADRLLEGCASEEDVRELEEVARSHAARQFLAEYLLLTGELHWLAGAYRLGEREERAIQSKRLGDAGTGQVLESPPRTARWKRAIWWRTLVPLALGLVCIAGILFWQEMGSQSRRQWRHQSPLIGSLVRTYLSDIEGAGDVIIPGRWVVMRQGVAEWRLTTGPTLIVQAPARFCLRENGEVELVTGTIFVNTNGAGGFFGVETPHAHCVDRGTAFGVRCHSTQTEIHVLEGEVEITARGIASHATLGLGKGRAVICDENGGIREVTCRPERFCQAVPKALTVAAFRTAALSDERIWLYGAFESPPLGGKWYSVLGPEDFRPVLMHGTLTQLELEQVAGYEPQSKAVKLVRGAYSGDTVGVGLQSLDQVVLPQAVTVEMIFRFDGWPTSGGNTLGCLLSTRQDQRRWSVLLGAIPITHGENAASARLVHLLDGRSRWTETQGVLVPGCWYYVAATFDGNERTTRVSTWLVNLSERGPFICVFKDGLVAGTPTGGYLGVGKGFDAGMSHAYPFPGAIDELAIYNGVLGEREIRSHLAHLVEVSAEESVLPMPPGPSNSRQGEN
ncbi:MAG: FecR domain-containing protein [Thermogutta sp.]